MSAAAVSVVPSGTEGVDALLGEARWSTAALSYGFPTPASDWSGYAAGAEPFDRLVPLSAAQQGAVSAALAAWAQVCTLTFVPVSEPGQVAELRFAGTGQAGTAHTYYPNASPLGGDVWFGSRVSGAASWQPGTYEFATAVHEIGHALGLKHPQDSLGAGSVVGSEAMSLERSVMSYRSYAGGPLTGSYTVAAGSYPAGPMIDDIAAIQHLYGANYATNPGDTVYRFAPDQGVVFQTIWDGGGSDTYDASAYGTPVVIDLRPGHWSTLSPLQLPTLDVGNPAVRAAGNIASALLHGDDPRALIENASGGGGADTLTGNGAANVLTGNAGNDTIDGGAGLDTAVFHGASTQYRVTATGGVVSVSGPDGTDTLVNVERLRFDGDAVDVSALAAAPAAHAVYRFFNAQTGTHFYTHSLSERDSVLDTLAAFRFEGVAFASTGDSGHSVWRFFNTQTGTHFYTVSDAERDHIQQTLAPYRFEGEAYKASTTPGAGLEPLYRFYNTHTGAHFYTASAAEHDAVLATLPQFQEEGVAYYVDFA